MKGVYLSAKQLKSQRLEILFANSPEDSWNYNPSAGFIPAFSTKYWFSELKKTKFINWHKELIVGVKMLKWFKVFHIFGIDSDLFTCIIINIIII